VSCTVSWWHNFYLKKRLQYPLNFFFISHTQKEWAEICEMRGRRKSRESHRIWKWKVGMKTSRPFWHLSDIYWNS
jgi:hypothetical protein